MAFYRSTQLLLTIQLISGALGLIDQHHFEDVNWRQISLNSVLPDKNCYPWMFHNTTSGACECGDIPNQALLCDPTIPRTSILDCYCMTYNAEQNVTELGRCLLGCGHEIDALYNELPEDAADLNSYVCGKAKRDSTLCGKCMPGYSPLVYSYDMNCMNCTGLTYNWIKYIAVAYIPLTIFFFLVVIFRFSGTSPLVRGFITICQGLVSPMSVRAYLSVIEHNAWYTQSGFRVGGSIYGIWNLDFFRTVLPPICLNISPLQALALDYATAFYPLFLVVITCTLIYLHSRDVWIVVWMWKPFLKISHSIKRDWDIQGSVIKAFATFFLLSYLKNLNVTTDLLLYTTEYILPPGEKSYQIKRTLYYDASVEYFQGEHLFYGITAILVGIFVVILPLVFLVIYPKKWFQKCLNRLHIQRQPIDMFVDCYQGYYKDGTDGSKDYRYFSVVYFVFQILVFVFFSLSKSICCFPLAAICAMLYAFAILGMQPYKERFKSYTFIDAFMLFSLSTFFILITTANLADLKAVELSSPLYILAGVIAIVPLLYMIGLIIWWVFVKKKFKQKFFYVFFWMRQKLCTCFRVHGSSVQFEESNSQDLPDRIENPSTYDSHTQDAPLLSVNEETHHQRYGSVPKLS